MFLHFNSVIKTNVTEIGKMNTVACTNQVESSKSNTILSGDTINANSREQKTDADSRSTISVHYDTTEKRTSIISVIGNHPNDLIVECETTKSSKWYWNQVNQRRKYILFMTKCFILGKKRSNFSI